MKLNFVSPKCSIHFHLSDFEFCRQYYLPVELEFRFFNRNKIFLKQFVFTFDDIISFQAED